LPREVGNSRIEKMKAHPKRIVVVGGVAAGASAATKARRTDEGAEIIVFERGPYVSFANCGLPYYVSGDIQELTDLLLMTPERFAKRYRIKVELHHEVTRIERETHHVEVVDLRSGELRLERYDRLILAPGGRPILPPIPGIKLPGVLSLATVPDAEKLRRLAQTSQVQEAVVVGAGFIGLEAAEALLKLGLRVHLVEKLPQVMPPMDPEMATLIAGHLADKGLHLHLGAEAMGFHGSDRLASIALSDGAVIPAQVAVVAIGVRPELTLAREAGLEVGSSGGVVVGDDMLTSDPSIYACGDVAEVTNLITGKRVRMPLAGPANKQGRVAGCNAAGGDSSFPGAVGTSIVKVCDLTAAKTGLSEREAIAAGFNPLVSYTHPLGHAGYYPGAEEMAMKLVADRASGRVLGAQIVGPKGVDKRIDVLATAIHGKMTVEDLEGLDLAYAPPYSSAKDPVIVAGFVAANEWRGEIEVVTAIGLAREVDGGKPVRLLDVRDPEEYEAGHIPGALLAPLDKLRASLDSIRRDGPITVYCGGGYRSYHACKILEHHGHKVRNLSGGYTSWNQAFPDRAELGNGLAVSDKARS
jgi:NADPH-dependent 2,4-dienoyl-CoA reductase/sulfur reductase-like enzyme/rhodanese-related sulfurtransferase